MSLTEITDGLMAPILVLNKSLEVYPEPFRGQRDIVLLVSFGAYKKFINNYLEITDYLSTETVLLRSKLFTDDHQFLVKAFYKDVACAIAKELYYSKQDGLATRIVHKIDGCHVYAKNYVDVYTEAFRPNLQRAKNDLVSLAKKAGYYYSPVALVNNAWLWNYASLLFAMSSPTDNYEVGFAEWSMEVVDGV